ncbi:MAG: class I SAM-dependent methyltransferase [Gordonia sp. (in: high G+C Gram-positive bacteria)]|uniref:class I SAM-dependent methyltransferase n=1 Tax=Gordonia sp. (in: high G+C Gram-positive bacteria) TaxID=84139 RepID=UPI0039E2A452
MTENDVKAFIEAHWDARAVRFDEGPTHGLHSDAQRAAWSSLIRTWVGRTPTDTLDVGCGTGFFALQLAALGHRTVGVDLAETMLALAREKAAKAGLDTVFQRGDAEELEFPDQCFDLLTARHLIWTLPDPAKALREWARVLRTGGRAVLVEGVWAGLTEADYHLPVRDRLPMYGGRPAREVGELALANGFTHVEVEPLTSADLWLAPQSGDRYALHAWT